MDTTRVRPRSHLAVPGAVMTPRDWRTREGVKVPRAECVSAGGFKKGPMSPAGFRDLMESMGAGELGLGGPEPSAP